MAFVLVAGREIGGVRPTEAKRNTEPLRAPDNNVDIELSWRFQQRKRENVGGNYDKRAGLVRLLNELSVIVDRAVGRGILHKRTKNRVVELEAREVFDLDLNAERFRARAYDFNRLRVTIVRDEKGVSIRSHGVTQRDRLGGGSRLVEQRCVCDLHGGKIGDHGLEIEQRFETALGELSLIRRVSGVPTRILQNISLDHGRRDAIGIASADKRTCDFVLLRNGAQFGERFRFGFRLRQI